MTRQLLWPDLEPKAIEEGWIADPFPSLSAAQVLDALSLRHSMAGWNGMPGRWVFAREVSAQTGLWGDQQRFDAVAIGLTPAVKYARVVYEVKVSRSDWQGELRGRFDVKRRYTGENDADGMPNYVREKVRRPGNKWDAALAVSTEFYIAAPPKVVQLSELPPEAGLVEIRPWGKDGELRARVVKAAPVRDTPNPGPEFWASMLRKAAAR